MLLQSPANAEYRRNRQWAVGPGLKRRWGAPPTVPSDHAATIRSCARTNSRILRLLRLQMDDISSPTRSRTTKAARRSGAIPAPERSRIRRWARRRPTIFPNTIYNGIEPLTHHPSMRALNVLLLLVVPAGASPDVVRRASELYQRTEYQQSLHVLAEDPAPDAAGYHLSGKNYFMLGDHKRAIDFFEKALAISPALSTSLKRRSQFLLPAPNTNSGSAALGDGAPKAAVGWWPASMHPKP